MPYPLTLERIGTHELIAKEPPDEVLDRDTAAAVVRHSDACNALVCTNAQYGDTSVHGTATKSLTPGEVGSRPRGEDTETFDMTDPEPPH